MLSIDGPQRLAMATADVDRAAAHRWLTFQSSWARDRTRELQNTAIDGSRIFSALDVATGRQLACARVITDGATFAWLHDAIGDAAHRGQGAARLLIDGVMQSLGRLASAPHPRRRRPLRPRRPHPLR